MKKLMIVTQCLFWLVALIATPASALTVPEKLKYDVSWTGITAGNAVQEVTEQGDDLRIVNTIHSTGMVSMMLSVDDKTESVIPRKSPASLPRFYMENINEGKTHHHKEGTFDFSSHTVHTKDLLKKTETTDKITDSTYDSLSSIYYIRSKELTPGQKISFQLYDFKHLYDAAVKVVKREQIRTSVGKFQTLKVTSELTFNGKPAKAGNTTMWLTDDDRHIPVKIVTKLKVGEITLTLTGGSYWPK